MISEKDFTYCPRCSATFTEKTENMLICNHCNLHYYINPKACNATILENEKGEILLVKRSREPQKGFYDLPGGFVDLQETIEESVHRELQEELNITVEKIEYITSFHDTYQYKELENFTICAVFKAKVDSQQEIKPADDVAEFQWFKPQEVPLEKIAFIEMKKMLERILGR